jgi:hypothetical protein
VKRTALDLPPIPMCVSVEASGSTATAPGEGWRSECVLGTRINERRNLEWCYGLGSKTDSNNRTKDYPASSSASWVLDIGEHPSIAAFHRRRWSSQAN